MGDNDADHDEADDDDVFQIMACITALTMILTMMMIEVVMIAC